MAEATVRQIWGIAKCQELKLTDEELHLLVSAHTGKDSIKELNTKERKIMVGILLNLKDSAAGKKREKKRNTGNTATVNQRKKIYRLTEELGWDKPSRVNGMCKRMFGVCSVEWLDYQQCSKLIEALKSMLERKGE